MMAFVRALQPYLDEWRGHWVVAVAVGPAEWASLTVWGNCSTIKKAITRLWVTNCGFQLWVTFVFKALLQSLKLALVKAFKPGNITEQKSLSTSPSQPKDTEGFVISMTAIGSRLIQIEEHFKLTSWRVKWLNQSFSPVKSFTKNFKKF